MIWNRRTGNLVGGHQRLRALDSLNEGNKDYTLRVSVVDLSSKEEKSANILLNNPEAQGEWDFEKLGLMLKDPELDLIASGMGAGDVYKLIGDEAPDAVLLECAEKIEQAHAIADHTQEVAESHNDGYYAVVVFRNHQERLKFTARLGVEDNRYVNGEDLMRRLPYRQGEVEEYEAVYPPPAETETPHDPETGEVLEQTA